MCLQKEITTRVRGCWRSRLSRETSGQELVEFAMMVLVLFALILGIVWFGRVISVYQALGRAAREGARVYLQSTCATCGNAPDQTAATTAINNALTAATLDNTQALISIQNSQNLVSANSPNYDQALGVTINIKYQVQMGIPFVPNGGNIWVGTTVSMRQEY